jgi:hypothetical protein
VWNGTLTVALTVLPDPEAHPDAHVTVWVDEVDRFAAASTEMAVASAAELLNGDERAPTRADSRAASETTATVSHSRLTSNVAKRIMKSAGMMMTNSTNEDPRSRQRLAFTGRTILSHLGGVEGPKGPSDAPVDPTRPRQGPTSY